MAEQQKNERVKKIKNRILKQTHDTELAENLSPLTKKLDEVSKSTQESLTQKLDTINESTQKVGNLIKESNSEIIPSKPLKNTFESLSDATNSLKLNKDKDDILKILCTSIHVLGGDKIQVNNNIYEFTPEIHKALSNSSYTGKSMRDINDTTTLYNFSSDIGYDGHGDHKTSQRKYFSRLFNHFRNIKKEEPTNLGGHGVKIIIPSNIIDIYTRLEILLGLKLSGHSDTLTEASNLTYELHKRGEIQNKQQYKNALIKLQI